MIVIQKINKQFPSLGRNKFLSLLLLFVIYIWAIIHTYDFQIAEANAYAGMRPWLMTASGWFYLSIVLIFLTFVASRLKGNPSDFFITFYSAIPIISFCTLTSTSGGVGDHVLFPSLAVIIFPLISMLAAQYFLPTIKRHGIIPPRFIDNVLLGILFFTIGYSYLNSPGSVGFDIISSYDRRLEGREIYAAGSLIAYMLGMSMNGIASYLAFRGVINKKILLIFIAIGAVIFFYWLLGVKAPIFYVLFGCFLAYLTRRNYLCNFTKYFLMCIIGLYFLVLIEWSLYDDYSIIADYGFRRLFSVQAQIQGYYLDFLMLNTPTFWSFLSGVHDQLFSAGYYIGFNYMGNQDSNANTNAFLHAFVANGILGYFVAIIFVSVFFVILDRLYRSTRNPTYILLGFIYGYLIIEQAFTTAMISSGVGLLFLLTFFEKYDPPILNNSNLNV